MKRREPPSRETIEKIRQSNLGQKRTATTCENISKGLKRHWASQQVRVGNGSGYGNGCSYYSYCNNNNNSSSNQAFHYTVIQALF